MWVEGLEAEAILSGLRASRLSSFPGWGLRRGLGSLSGELGL